MGFQLISPAPAHPVNHPSPSQALTHSFSFWRVTCGVLVVHKLPESLALFSSLDSHPPTGGANHSKAVSVMQVLQPWPFSCYRSLSWGHACRLSTLKYCSASEAHVRCFYVQCMRGAVRTRLRAWLGTCKSYHACKEVCLLTRRRHQACTSNKVIMNPPKGRRVSGHTHVLADMQAGLEIRNELEIYRFYYRRERSETERTVYYCWYLILKSQSYCAPSSGRSVKVQVPEVSVNGGRDGCP